MQSKKIFDVLKCSFILNKILVFGAKMFSSGSPTNTEEAAYNIFYFKYYIEPCFRFSHYHY